MPGIPVYVFVRESLSFHYNNAPGKFIDPFFTRLFCIYIMKDCCAGIFTNRLFEPSEVLYEEFLFQMDRPGFANVALDNIDRRCLSSHLPCRDKRTLALDRRVR
jgi:hypothetical protein